MTTDRGTIWIIRDAFQLDCINRIAFQFKYSASVSVAAAINMQKNHHHPNVQFLINMQMIKWFSLLLIVINYNNFLPFNSIFHFEFVFRGLGCNCNVFFLPSVNSTHSPFQCRSYTTIICPLK